MEQHANREEIDLLLGCDVNSFNVAYDTNMRDKSMLDYIYSNNLVVK